MTRVIHNHLNPPVEVDVPSQFAGTDSAPVAGAGQTIHRWRDQWGRWRFKILGAINAYADYALALHFKNSIYVWGGAQVTDLTEIPGASFSDNVDNVPNIDASGYTALESQISNLRVANPIAVDGDFLIFGVANFPDVESTSYDMLFSLQQAGSNPSYYGTRHVGKAYLGQTVGEVSNDQAVGAVRAVIGIRRSSGVNTLFSCVAGTVASLSGSPDAFTPGATLFVGSFNGTLQLDAPLEFLGVRLGTFSDAETTTIFQEALQ